MINEQEISPHPLVFQSSNIIIRMYIMFSPSKVVSDE